MYDAPAALPTSLHSRLYLLARDRRRHRLDRQRLWLFGFSLRAAMLTDLYLRGYLQDDEGKATLTGGARPGDPLLRTVLTTVEVNEPKTWEWLIVTGQDLAPAFVGHQLTEHRWLRREPYRKLGMFPATRWRLGDECMVAGLHAGVDQAVADALAGRPSDRQLLALGLIGILGEIGAALGDSARATQATQLLSLTEGAIAPIKALRAAVESAYAEIAGKSDGGVLTGVGCGGGCGGCGGCGG